MRIVRFAQIARTKIFHYTSTSQCCAANNSQVIHSTRFHRKATVGMNLSELMSRLNGFASPNLAAGWDNVGLLVEPSCSHVVSRLLLTNDLTQSVVDEAISLDVNMILSYHPPIFKALKTLTQQSWKERIIVKCIENRIAVYSPHTILDSLKGGVNDWLISPFEGDSRPLVLSARKPAMDISVFVTRRNDEDLHSLITKLQSIPGTTFGGCTKLDAGDVSIRVSCKQSSLLQVVQLFEQFDVVKDTLEIVQLSKVPVEGCGEGRITTLSAPVSLRQAVDLVKSHLKLAHVRLACGAGQTLESPIATVAVCAGSGGGMLTGVKAGLFVTGEMSHHELLEATQNGTCVILTEHSNSERGYLVELARTLNDLFQSKVEMKISTVDRDPIEIV